MDPHKLARADAKFYSGEAHSIMGDYYYAAQCYARAARIYWKCKNFEHMVRSVMEAADVLDLVGQSEAAADGIRIVSMMLVKRDEPDMALKLSYQLRLLECAHPGVHCYIGGTSFYNYVFSLCKNKVLFC
jgi:hypothetical protein